MVCISMIPSGRSSPHAQPDLALLMSSSTEVDPFFLGRIAIVIVVVAADIATIVEWTAAIARCNSIPGIWLGG